VDFVKAIGGKLVDTYEQYEISKDEATTYMVLNL
jgi:hypothetical protein